MQFRCFLFLLIPVLLSGFLTHAEEPESLPGKSESLPERVELRKLADNVWLHISTQEVKGFGTVPANGLVVVSEGKGMMIDLPWTDAQAKVIFDWFASEQGVAIDMVVPTHSHKDCAGGLAEAHRLGADSWGLAETVKKLKAEKKAAPQNSFSGSKTFKRGAFDVICSFEGQAHTVDNIVAWIPERKILFGGCAVKSLEAESIGYIKEANMKSWPTLMTHLSEKYAATKILIPGHGAPGDLELLRHTSKMVKGASQVQLRPGTKD